MPYVTPKSMNFLRYGIDHYIPGSDADHKAGNNYDNEFYSMNNANYSPALAKMTRQLAMVNPDITFDDKFQTKGLDTKIFSLLRKKFIQDGSFYLLNDYLDTLFMNYLTGWTSVDRAKYAADIQTALRDYMAVLYDATPAQSALFSQRVKGMIDNDIGVRDALGIVRYALGKWHRPGYKYKKYYTDKLINMMNDNKCFEALELDESVKQKLIRVDLPFILDFIMTFASVDYDNNFYDTRGLTQLLTLVMNLTNIFLNHAPEVTLAWLRSYDSLYDGETGVVTSASFAISDNYKFKYSESLDDNNNAILDIGDVDDAFATRGTEPYTVLPKTVTAGYSNGDIKELAINWDRTSVKWYSHAKEVSEDLWTEIPADDLTAALRGPEALKAEFTGKVNTSGAALYDGVSDEVTGSVYIAGLVRLDTPDASLPDGEYYGSQLVSLTHSNTDGKIIYSLSELFEYEDGSMGGGGMFPEEYKGAVKIGSDDAKEQHHYMLNAWVESSNSNLSADSEIMVWEYIINPASDDTNSDYIGRTRSHTFVYSKDIAVFWRIMSSEVKVTGSNANLAELQDTIYINPAPYDAETVKTKTFDVTVITVAGTTLKGVYSIPVRYSEDGITWTDAAVIKFNTVTGSADISGDDDDDSDVDTSPNGSSSGCDVGVLSGALALIAVLVVLQLKAKYE
ncbi:MAG: Ig-like domain-containing protein [Synergistaceae bacterium]|nr:Ig-like domain-containing protein [Synergistaceae bacterium]